MRRTWIDPRDGLRWEIAAVPVMERAIPFDPEAMVGEPTSTLVMRTAGASHAYIVEPVIGVRISNLSNSEIAALLDEARSHRRRVTPER